MREEKGSGMSDEKVIDFVNGCMKTLSRFQTSVEHELTSVLDYPAYELYTEVLRNGIFGDDKGKQLRLVVDKSRRVKDVQHI